MKIIKTVFLTLCLALLFVGCNSSKQAKEVEGDSYQIESIESDEENSLGSKKVSSSKKESSGKKKGFSLANIFASKFFEYDQTTLFTAGTFGGIKQQNAITVYYPKTGNAGFGSPIMAAYYYLTFDEANRAKIEKAVNQYLSDFENKKLDRKAKKSFKAYGSVKASLYWGTVKNSSPNNAVDNIYLGYSFVGNSPYFTLYMYPTTNAMYTGPDCNYTEKSILLQYFFTKAQAKSLVEKLSNENVSNAIRAYENETLGVPAVIDDYDEDIDYESAEDDVVREGIDDGVTEVIEDITE